ncbi:MAG: hypothetical protein QM765_28335 [Myxococcales bacterium]
MALRQSLALCCRLGVALSTLPDSPSDADEESVAALLAEVEGARAALRDAKKADPKSSAALSAERQINSFAMDFARGIARAGIKARGKSKPPRRAAPAPAFSAPPQTAAEIVREFNEDAPLPKPMAAATPASRIRLLVGGGVLVAGVGTSVAVQLSLSEPATPPSPKVLFAPPGSKSLVGQHTGVSMVDLGRNATAEQIASFKAAAAANGKAVREIAPGQFIFTHHDAADAGTAVALADGGGSPPTTDSTERAP